MADRIELFAARLLELHALLIGGDQTAVEQLADELWPLLYRRLRRSFPHTAADFIADASNDAMLTYAQRPHAFDSSRQVPLDHFLYGIAARILRDRLRSDRRRFVRESAYAEHILWAYGGHIDDRATTARAAMKELRDALPFVCNQTELSAMVAWLNEDDTGVVAVRLGLSNLRLKEQRREVKRFTARVIKRLQRYLHVGMSKRRSHSRVEKK